LQDDVVAAQPEIDVRTEQLVSRGRWMVPGYKVYLLFLSSFLSLSRVLYDEGDVTG
jgi:hypothetical protein